MGDTVILFVRETVEDAVITILVNNGHHESDTTKQVPTVIIL